MINHHYSWKIGEPPPLLGEHSLAKHKVLERYIERYLTVLTSPFGMREFRLAIVEGFCGGGTYTLDKTGELVPGSPLIFLDAVEAVITKINCARDKNIDFTIDYYFCDSDRDALNFLDDEIRRKGHGDRIGKSIFLVQGEFSQTRHHVAQQIENKGKRVNRSIWLLDQYSYKDVAMSGIRDIFSRFPEAEVLLTFGIDNLVDFISDNKAFETALNRLELNAEQIEYVVALKGSNKNWKQLAQKSLYRHLVESTGARFYTPFFITSRRSNRSYWFVHLSQHAKARDEMAQLHWAEHNYFSHFGGAGLDMLGFDPLHGPDPNQSEFEFGFDDDARGRSKQALISALPDRILRHEMGTSFEHLFSNIANETPATTKILEEALVELRDEGELDFFNANGRRKDRARKLKPQDQIRITASPMFSWSKKTKR